MAAYAGDHRLISTNESVSITVGSEHPLSLSAYGEVLSDIESLYKFSARETSARIKGSNVKKRDSVLGVYDFKAGSLEIFANPYVQGVITSVVATAITSVFIYVARRINGRPESTREDPLLDVDKAVIGEDKLREAASEAVTRSASSRKRLNNKIKTFGLEIKIRVGDRNYDVS